MQLSRLLVEFDEMKAEAHQLLKDNKKTEKLIDNANEKIEKAEQILKNLKR